MGINIKEQDKILIVAPHPDDESIGCGGLLSLYASQCDVLLVTDGASREAAKEVAKIREAEFVKAVTSIEVNNYYRLRIPQHQVKAHRNDISQIDFSKYHHIFVPNRYDAHCDHVAVYRVVSRIAKRQSSKTKIYEYEVWSPLQKPNIYLNITDVVERKRELIEYHKSQMADLDYVGMILGLNAYRGRSHGYPYAECYYCPIEKRKEKIRRIKRKIKEVFVHQKKNREENSVL